MNENFLPHLNIQPSISQYRCDQIAASAIFSWSYLWLKKLWNNSLLYFWLDKVRRCNNSVYGQFESTPYLVLTLFLESNRAP